MATCWKADPATRPTVSECKRALASALEQRSSSDYRQMLANLNEVWLNISTSLRNVPSSGTILEDSVPDLGVEIAHNQSECSQHSSDTSSELSVEISAFGAVSSQSGEQANYSTPFETSSEEGDALETRL